MAVKYCNGSETVNGNGRKFSNGRSLKQTKNVKKTPLRAIIERSHVLRGIVPGIPVADMADATPGFTGADLVLVVSKLEREVGIQVQSHDLVNDSVAEQ